MLEIGVFIVLTLFVGVLLREYLKIHGDLERLQKEKIDIEYKARQRAIQLVEEARNKAEELIQKAASKAFAEEKDISKDLESIAAEHREMYKKILQNISEEVESQAVREIKELSNSMYKESNQVSKELNEALKQEYLKAEKDIDAYKENKLRELKLQLADLSIDISRTVVGKSMSAEMHMELVERLLKEARAKHAI